MDSEFDFFWSYRTRKRVWILILKIGLLEGKLGFSETRRKFERRYNNRESLNFILMI